MKAANVACVVLASGLSERFGQANKLFAELGGKSVLSHVLETAAAIGFGEVFCVSRGGHGGGYTAVENVNPQDGQGHALRLGLGAARAKGWEYCVLLLGDMPLIMPSHLENLILKIENNQCVVSESESVRMPPAIFNAVAMDIILAEKSEFGARDIFDKLNPATLPLDRVAAHDVDTPADLARVAEMIKVRKS